VQLKDAVVNFSPFKAVLSAFCFKASYLVETSVTNMSFDFTALQSPAYPFKTVISKLAFPS